MRNSNEGRELLNAAMIVRALSAPSVQERTIMWAYYVYRIVCQQREGS